MTDLKPLDQLRISINGWNEWRAQHKDVVIDLSRAPLSGADLNGANLKEANLISTYLSRAQLSGANLNGANLSEAHLDGANLSKASLSRAHLSGAYLSGANLSKANLIRASFRIADLSGADFSRADLSGADFSGARINGTIFNDLDLRTIKGLETIIHDGPSGITTSALERSEGDIPEVFLRRAGLSDTFITYARSLTQHPIEYYTCFISYTKKDQAFAERLYSDLQNKGVRCWYAPKELKPGDYYRHRIDESIRVYDKLILVLSKESIKSTEVEKEVQQAEEREESMPMDTQVLFPIRMDDTVMQTQRRWVQILRYHRHIGDFTKWKDHDHYQQAFQQLLDDIKHSKPRQRHQEQETS